MSEGHFDQPKREWSARKHGVLREYFPAFCRALSRQGTIWYVDGFAGAGRYQDPSNPEALSESGSPIVAASIADQLPYDVRCLNVEENQTNYASLAEVTRDYPHVINIHADFNDVVGQVLTIVERHPAFFFLDPFGAKDLPMEGLIDRIAVRSKPTDILARYATETVRRLAGAFEKDRARRDAHAKTLDRWFRGGDWRSILESFPAGTERDTTLLHYYLSQLVSISGGRIQFAAEYPIRTISGNTKYHLVFSTGNKLGVKLMSDVLYKAENEYRSDQSAYKQQQRQQAAAEQLALFEAETASEELFVDQQRQYIRASILELASAGRTTWKFEELRFSLMLEMEWFARMSEKEFRDALKSMHSAGEIERLSSGRAWNNETSFQITM